MGGLIIICMLFWVILSERFTIEGIVIGSIITLIVLHFNKDFRTNLKLKEFMGFNRVKLWIFYFMILVREIFMANFHVAKIVLSPRLNISPMTVRIKTDIKSGLNKTIYANSITLTPGTLTILEDNDELLIHCLEEKSAQGLVDSVFEKIIMKVEE